MKKEYIKSAFDGVIQGILLCLLLEYFVSIFFSYTTEFTVFVLLIIFCLISLVSLYFLIFRKADKPIWRKYIISFMFFVAVHILNFINLMWLRIRILPLRETSNGDGLVLLFLVGSHFAFLVISRLVALIINFIIKKVKKS